MDDPTLKCPEERQLLKTFYETMHGILQKGLDVTAPLYGEEVTAPMVDDEIWQRLRQFMVNGP
jgi:hypothetical protein